MAEKKAIEATVTGNDQQVGFRALVMKQAIEYNLAGSAKNDANKIVHFTLQGDWERIKTALDVARQGTKKSGPLHIDYTEIQPDDELVSFTIIDWTSQSRDITNQYNLVFQLRGTDGEISKHDAKAKWREVLEDTVSPTDQEKLHPDDFAEGEQSESPESI